MLPLGSLHLCSCHSCGFFADLKLLKLCNLCNLFIYKVRAIIAVNWKDFNVLLLNTSRSLPVYLWTSPRFSSLTLSQSPSSKKLDSQNANHDHETDPELVMRHAGFQWKSNILRGIARNLILGNMSGGYIGVEGDWGHCWSWLRVLWGRNSPGFILSFSSN